MHGSKGARNFVYIPIDNFLKNWYSCVIAVKIVQNAAALNAIILDFFQHGMQLRQYQQILNIVRDKER